jgi:uncharacterized protein
MTNLKEQLHTDLTAAIKAKDSLTSGTLRMVLSAITNEEVSGKEARVLNDQDMITVFNREAKKRKEAAAAYDDAKRPELADKERAELEIIQAYLTGCISDEDLANIIAALWLKLLQAGATGPSAMGAVMKIVSPQVSGRADGGAVAAAVKSALA